MAGIELEVCEHKITFRKGGVPVFFRIGLDVQRAVLIPNRAKIPTLWLGNAALCAAARLFIRSPRRRGQAAWVGTSRPSGQLREIAGS